MAQHTSDTLMSILLIERHSNGQWNATKTDESTND